MSDGRKEELKNEYVEEHQKYYQRRFRLLTCIECGHKISVDKEEITPLDIVSSSREVALYVEVSSKAIDHIEILNSFR